MASDSASPQPLSKGAIFIRRLSSSLLLWAIVLGGLFSPNKVLADSLFCLMMVGFGGLGMLEFYQMVGKKGVPCFPKLGMAGGLILILGLFGVLCGHFGRVKSPAQADSVELGILSLVLLAIAVRQFLSKDNSNGVTTMAVSFFGVVYVAWLLNFIMKLYYFPFVDDGTARLYVLYFIAVTKFSDLGAYVVGSLIGKHKMIPRVSPGKTWEGFGGALVISTLVSVLFVYFGGEKLQGMTYLHAVVLGLILAIAAVVGDLIMSLLKRETGVKDSGRFFPGIGGILDLLDSLLFNAPLMYLYLRFFLVAG